MASAQVQFAEFPKRLPVDNPWLIGRRLYTQSAAFRYVIRHEPVLERALGAPVLARPR